MSSMPVRFFNGGHCLQLQALVDRRTWRIEPFYAVFLAVQHPGRGWVLIDTGYSTGFRAATQGWPSRLYRWVTPVTSTRSTAEILSGVGIDPTAVCDIVVTHFHADHVGGLNDFPRARFHFCATALAPLRALRPFAQTRHAFLPKLIPADFDARSCPVPLEQFDDRWKLGFASFDLFGDGTIILVSLPGHAPGHVGIFLPHAEKGPLFYVADAYWHHRQVEETLEPSPPAKIFIHDRAAYRATVVGLRALARRRDLTLLACHCPRTQEWISPTGSPESV